MISIKIISNPYKKEIRYQKLNEVNGEWTDITYDNSPNSRLLSSELTAGFFPFRAKQIVDVIVEEYGVPGEEIRLFFEGAADEYQELKDVCALDSFGAKISLERTGRTLANARDILPEVKGLFQEMSPLILGSISADKIQHDLERFTDASSDVVPVCVLGNYSAGKSTFINALIGAEILPSGAEPVTAKVYKIARSSFSDRASVKCKYLGKDVVVSFSDRDTHIDAGVPGNPLDTLLRKEIADAADDPMAQRVSRALSVINDYEDSTEEVMLSDLIEVEFPFANGVLSKTQHPFVIFDTPGSNSASNAKHLQVLKDAMANMTNGLPIFLCTPDSLDSTDNENLYHIIRDFEELDNRFTMIVVNKADAPGIQRKGSTAQEQKRILSQAVPRNLYSGGLFYVSSILGLGAKTGGVFADYDYEDVFAAQEARYRDKDNRFYRNLYLFNILPEQIDQRSDALAAEQSDLVYANSGLFSIETEIENFAGKHAAYNKCFQSQMFLRKVIQQTIEEIASKKETQEGYRASIVEKLETDKKQLVDKLQQASDEKGREFDEAYDPLMSGFLPDEDGNFSAKELKEKEFAFTAKQEELQGYSDLAQERNAAWKNVKDEAVAGIRQGFSSLFSKEKKDSRDINLNVTDAWDKTAQLRELRHAVDTAAAQDLLEYVKMEFERKLQEYNERIESESRTYWTDGTEKIRDLFAEIVSGSKVLTDEKRAELKRIIITYQPVAFPENTADKIFVKEEFQRRVAIGSWDIWKSDHLNLESIAKTYNKELKDNVEQQYRSVSESHKGSATSWLESLLAEIIEHIVDYSPELSQYAKQIRDLSKEIQDLDKRRVRLEEYTDELGSMMDWKEQ